MRRTSRCAALLTGAAIALSAASLVGALPSPAAAASSPAVHVITDLHYAAPASTANAVDVYEPAGARGAPMVVVVHGGGFVSGDKSSLAAASRGLAAAGYVVFAVNYSLDPALGPAYPREVDDVQASLAWARLHAGEYGGDPRRVGIVGESAGAYLAAMAGLASREDGEPVVRAVVSLSGPMQLTTYPGLGQNRCTAACTASTVADLRALLGCSAARCPVGLLRAASPAEHVTHNGPAFFLANSSTELIPLDQATGMAASLRAAHDRVDLVVLPGTGHGGDYLSQIGDQVLAFLRQTLAPPARALKPAAWLIGSIAGLVVVAALASVTAVLVRRRRASPSGYV